MHKDLSDECRRAVELTADELVQCLHDDGQSLGIAREAWINAFDRAAEELENNRTLCIFCLPERAIDPNHGGAATGHCPTR